MNIAKPPYDSKGSILIALCYWEGDKDLARKVAKLMADLQPHHVGNVCEVLIVARQDEMNADSGMVRDLQEKFNVKTMVTSSPLRGWPGGCNGMFGSAMIQIANYISTHDCVFWMEADCVPMYPNWFSDLHHEWMNRRSGSNIVGCICDAHGDGSGIHLTGCAIYHPQIARLLPEITSCDNIAWDWLWRAQMVKMGSHTNAINLQYKMTAPKPELLNLHYSVTHGYKTDWLLNAVRAKHQV